MASELSLLLKGVAAGTLLGLVGPGVLLLILCVRYPPDSFQGFIEVFLIWELVCGLPGFVSALIGGLEKVVSGNSGCPHFCVGFVVIPGWLLLSFALWGWESSLPFVLTLTTSLAANSWFAAWYAIRIVSKGMPQPRRKTMRLRRDTEKVARMRFQANSKKTDTDAIRIDRQETTEQP